MTSKYIGRSQAVVANQAYSKVESDAKYLTDLVADTTPQLGGDLDTNGNHISFGDNDEARFGDGNNLKIYGSGGYSYIDESGANELNIRTNGSNIGLYDTANSQYLAKFNTAGSAVLYFNGSSKFATQSDGAYIQGTNYLYPSSGSGRVERVVIPRFTPNYPSGGVAGDWQDLYTPAIGESGKMLITNVNSTGGEYRYAAELVYSRAQYQGHLSISLTEYINGHMADFRVTGTDSTSKIQIRNTYGYGTKIVIEITRLFQ